MRFKKKSHNSRRGAGKRVLIVCEGKVTELSYFNHIKKELGVRTASIRVVHGDCTDPLSIFNFANDKAIEEEKDGEKYDKIFCVFDRDRHDKNRFQKACDKMKSEKGWRKDLTKILSVPCIEYWFLLHFEFSTAAGDTANTLKAKLNSKNYLKKYDKEIDKENFSRLWENYKKIKNNAKDNAIKANKQAKSANTDDPTTEIYLLVDYLKNL